MTNETRGKNDDALRAAIRRAVDERGEIDDDRLQMTSVDAGDVEFHVPGLPDGLGVFARDHAQIGLRVKRHNTYHGLSLNIDMDLEPFERINPCGYAGLAVTDMRREGSELAVSRPEVIFREIDGEICEPYEQVTIDIEEQHQGAVMEALGERRGDAGVEPFAKNRALRRVAALREKNTVLQLVK
mgnify:CR=1 FL=1